jgi:hypothetical protein
LTSGGTRREKLQKHVAPAKIVGNRITPQEDKTEIPAEIVPVIVRIHLKKLIEIGVESVSEFFHVVPMDSPD